MLTIVTSSGSDSDVDQTILTDLILESIYETMIEFD